MQFLHADNKYSDQTADADCVDAQTDKSLCSALQESAVVSFWQKNVHKYWLMLRRLSLLRKSVPRHNLTVDWAIQLEPNSILIGCTYE